MSDQIEVSKEQEQRKSAFTRVKQQQTLLEESKQCHEPVLFGQKRQVEVLQEVQNNPVKKKLANENFANTIYCFFFEGPV